MVKDWKKFWLLPITPESRTIWYRTILGKLHYQQSIAQFREEVSGICHFCLETTETIHLLIECPKKREVWHQLISSFAPHLYFWTEDIIQLVCRMKHFQHIDNNKLHILISNYMVWTLAIWINNLYRIPGHPSGLGAFFSLKNQYF